MANFIPPDIITAGGEYEINTRFSRNHLLTLKGEFDGQTVTMTTYDDATGSYSAVANGSWAAEAEFRFYAPSDKVRLSVDGGGTSPAIAVTLTPTFTR